MLEVKQRSRVSGQHYQYCILQGPHSRGSHIRSHAQERPTRRPAWQPVQLIRRLPPGSRHQVPVAAHSCKGGGVFDATAMRVLCSCEPEGSCVKASFDRRKLLPPPNKAMQRQGQGQRQRNDYHTTILYAKVYAVKAEGGQLTGRQRQRRGVASKLSCEAGMHEKTYISAP